MEFEFECPRHGKFTKAFEAVPTIPFYICEEHDEQPIDAGPHRFTGCRQKSPIVVRSVLSALAAAQQWAEEQTARMEQLSDWGKAVMVRSREVRTENVHLVFESHQHKEELRRVERKARLYLDAAEVAAERVNSLESRLATAEEALRDIRDAVCLDEDDMREVARAALPKEEDK